jgi:hypothetical protein
MTKATTGLEARLAQLYHESLHAYIDVGSNAATKRIMTIGEGYYKDAPLENGSTVSDTEKVTQEAACEYAGNRVQYWWIAFQNLATITAVIDSEVKFKPEKLKRDAVFAQDYYNKNIGALNFGYESGTLKNESHVLKPIFPELKAYVDNEILEGKITDTFRGNAKLVGLFNDIMKL